MTDAGVTQWKHYIAAPSGPVAVYIRKSSGTPAAMAYYLTRDHLGSVDSITDSTGALQVRLSYNAFGERRKEAGWVDANLPAADWTAIYAITHRGYTFHEMLDDLGLVHMNGRVYDQISARFVSADPFIDGVGNTQGFNRYSYVKNSPLSYTDPSGFAEQGVCSNPNAVPPRAAGGDKGKGADDGVSGEVTISHRCPREPHRPGNTGAPNSEPDYGPGEDGEQGHGSHETIEEVLVTADKPQGGKCFAPTGNQTSPWRLGWEWLTGAGPRNRSFSDGDAFTELLRGHRNIQNLVNAARSGSIPSTGQWDYSVGGVDGVGLYLQDYSNLLTGGRTGNLAVTYLGSYDVDYSISGNTLSVHVTNTSTIQSATHPPIVGYTEWWGRNIGDRLDSAFSSGPMSRTTQQINMTFALAGGCP